MRPMRCFDATSAGLYLDGDVAVLSFRTNDLVNDSEASVVLTREMLRLLHDAVATALDDRKRAPGPARVRRDIARDHKKIRRELALAG